MNFLSTVRWVTPRNTGYPNSVIVAQIDIGNPDKILFPDGESDVDSQLGLTTRDLAQYYASVAQVMLPHLTGRPIRLERFPDGIGNGGFHDDTAPAHAWRASRRASCATPRRSTTPAARRQR